MENENAIAAEQFCRYYNIDTSFILLLEQHDLITTVAEGEQRFLSHDQLPAVEKYIHLHYDLEINIEGIEAIHHLLDRMEQMQTQLVSLQNRLVTP